MFRKFLRLHFYYNSFDNCRCSLQTNKHESVLFLNNNAKLFPQDDFTDNQYTIHLEERVCVSVVDLLIVKPGTNRHPSIYSVVFIRALNRLYLNILAI